MLTRNQKKRTLADATVSQESADQMCKRIRELERVVRSYQTPTKRKMPDCCICLEPITPDQCPMMPCCPQFVYCGSCFATEMKLCNHKFAYPIMDSAVPVHSYVPPPTPPAEWAPRLLALARPTEATLTLTLTLTFFNLTRCAWRQGARRQGAPLARRPARCSTSAAVMRRSSSA